MLQPIMHVLNAKKIVLASGSPRRKQILENIGLKFEVIPSLFEENLDKTKFEHVYDFVKETARKKVLDVAMRMGKQKTCSDLYIGADTVVTMDNQIYEKPTSVENAFETLSKFSGRYHTVYTGVVLLRPKADGCLTSEEGYHMSQFHETTEVLMTDMTPEVIQAYIDTGEPMDKAGGYGIQALGSTLVEGIKGDYFNVMGFPVFRFAKELVSLYGQPNKET
ncbi:probable bifunctional dTTP/UTP pyrophosphatase/methyltransferase protein [Liolophura sinensis]|uniref:probable bifunctional dTTP/UTP pyrophosphatase/methyltransferase protein n=1 Tax=Liolophura sinensis TaxID=3198878 RepID=UPI0031598FAF